MIDIGAVCLKAAGLAHSFSYHQKDMAPYTSHLLVVVGNSHLLFKLHLDKSTVLPLPPDLNAQTMTAVMLPKIFHVNLAIVVVKPKNSTGPLVIVGDLDL